MFIELHLLHAFPPAALNVDDTGAPKSAIVGGVPRARISSQAWKRAIRTYMRETGLLDASELSVRTRRLQDVLGRRLVAGGRDPEEAAAVASLAIRVLDLTVDDTGQTPVLLFVANSEIDALERACNDAWVSLLEAARNLGAQQGMSPASDGEDAAPAGAGDPTPRATGRGRAARDTTRSIREDRRAARDATRTLVPDDARALMRRVLTAAPLRTDTDSPSARVPTAVDLALFGRMIATMPGARVDGAAAVAHAVGVSRLEPETDFFTAVDDLLDADETGAGMIGTVEFNASTYYRYLTVNVAEVLDNLSGDAALARRGVNAFLRAALLAVPAGRQRSTAALTRPSVVLLTARRGPFSLVNAFLQPVASTSREGVMAQATRALARHWENTVRMYGGDDVAGAWLATDDDQAPLGALAPYLVSDVGAAVTAVLVAAGLGA